MYIGIFVSWQNNLSSDEENLIKYSTYHQQLCINLSTVHTSHDPCQLIYFSIIVQETMTFISLTILIFVGRI